LLTKIEHGEILEIRLERAPANALNPALVRELRLAIEAAPATGAKAIVLSGMPGMYSGGLDVPELMTLDRAAIGHFWQDFFRLLNCIALSPLPIVVAITGHSPAGGAVLALFCDMRIAAQGDFKIGLNEVQVGLPVPRVILAALVRLVGARRAERLAVHGLLVSPDEALQLGLVDMVVAKEEAVPAALAWCRGTLSLPSAAMQVTRGALRADFKTLFDTLGPATGEEMTRVWFDPETQSVLRSLVERLAAKKK
jgi:Delta3-Delta2-enoyl-CoA isomerase